MARAKRLKPPLDHRYHTHRSLPSPLPHPHYNSQRTNMSTQIDLSTFCELYFDVYSTDKPSPVGASNHIRNFMPNDIAETLRKAENTFQLMETWVSMWYLPLIYLIHSMVQRSWLQPPTEPPSHRKCVDSSACHWIRLEPLKDTDEDDEDAPKDGSQRGILHLGSSSAATRRQYLVEYRTDLDRSRRADPKPDSNTEHFVPSEATTRRVLQSFSEGHRNFRFVIHIDGKMMRLTRWDRSGGICTSPFNYTTVPGRKTLRTILWKLSGLSLEQAGYDPTATRLLPSDPDFVKMTELADPSSDEALNDIPDRAGHEVESDGPHTFQYVRKAFERSIRDRARRYRLQVPLPDGRVRTFLVGRAAYAAIDTDCRGTRGYVAWDAQSEGFVWLKDAWRDDYDIVPAEGDRLSQLHQDGVQGIPTLVCYADLDHYTESTVVQSLTAMKPLPQGTARAALVEDGARTGIRRHCRMVVAEVCKPLSEVENGRVMTSILRDGVQGGYHTSSSASFPRYLMTPYVVRSPRRSRVVVDAPAPRHQSWKSARSSNSGSRPRRHSSSGVEGPSRGLGALRANRGDRGQCRASAYPREGESLNPLTFSAPHAHH